MASYLHYCSSVVATVAVAVQVLAVPDAIVDADDGGPGPLPMPLCHGGPDPLPMPLWMPTMAVQVLADAVTDATHGGPGPIINSNNRGSMDY